MTDTQFQVGKLMPDEDAYIRTGANRNGDISSITSETVTALVRAKLAGGDASLLWPRQSSLYAMPAFTQTALSDPECNLAEMLAEEVDASFRSQLGAHSIDRFGPVKILRDPYSAKPYVLFYCEMERLPVPDGMAVEPISEPERNNPLPDPTDDKAELLRWADRLLETLIEGDPDELAADGGITVLDVWREEAKRARRAIAKAERT